jgi:hypothetical protein
MLTPAQQRAGFLLLGFMFIGMMLDTLGISLIIPILAFNHEKQSYLKLPNARAVDKTLEQAKRS